MEPITIEATVAAPKEKVWACYTEPAHVTQWNHASDDWHCPSATNDLRVGGTFVSRMEARDGSVGFDFTGIYDEVAPLSLIRYHMSDGRKVATRFEEKDGATHVVVTFDPESENPIEMQRGGWQAILNNFKKYTETN